MDMSTAKNNSTMFNYQYNLVLLFKILAILVTYFRSINGLDLVVYGSNDE